MATPAGQLHELDEENDRLLRERRELEGDEQVSQPGIYQISTRYPKHT